MTPTATLTPTSTPRPGREWARVLRVWDGNTVLIEGGLSVRYIGVATPGGGMFGRPVEPFGREAAVRNVELVEGRQVEIEADATDVDGDGFLLRYVYVDGVMVNATLLREGLARLAPLGPNTKYRQLLEQAEAAARAEPRNLWTLPTPTPTQTPPPSPTPTAEPSPTPTLGPAVPSPATAGPTPTRLPDAPIVITRTPTPTAGARDL